MIYVIGSGSGEGCLSQKAIETINQCEKLVLKTALCKSAQYFINNYTDYITLDDSYRKSRNFDTLNANIVKEILMLNKQYENIAYVVDGSGFDDSSVSLLYKKTDKITIIPSRIKAEILAALPSTSYTVYSAFDFINSQYPEFSSEHPLAVYEIDNAYTAAELKLKLFKYFTEEHQVFMCINGEIINIKLYGLDRQKNYDYSTQLLLPPADILTKKRYGFCDLLSIMNYLRGEGGCPWDREQTHDSIKNNAVEEAYELIEAINNKDIQAMEEESGDLLLQPVFQSLIAEEYSEFDIYDVISTLCRKLIHRHTHIFGDDNAERTSDALKTWEKNKNIEKNQDTFTKSLKGVARTFPAIMRAEKVQKRAAKCGFDFELAQDILDKVYEETEELKQAVTVNDKENIIEEGGDLLFAVINLLRRLNVDGETALNNTTDKFIKRFEYMENIIIKTGRSLDEVSLEEMEKYYRQSKNADKTP